VTGNLIPFHPLITCASLWGEHNRAAFSIPSDWQIRNVRKECPCDAPGPSGRNCGLPSKRLLGVLAHAVESAGRVDPQLESSW
jgi:hypothetical protein